MTADLLVSSECLVISGLVGAGVVLAAEFQRRKNPGFSPDLNALIIAFLGAAVLPYGIVLLFYPLWDPRPDLTLMVVYLPLAGMALLYAGIVTLLRAMK